MQNQIELSNHIEDWNKINEVKKITHDREVKCKFLLIETTQLEGLFLNRANPNEN